MSSFLNKQIVSCIEQMAGEAYTELDLIGMEFQVESNVFDVAATNLVKTFVCTFTYRQSRQVQC